MRSQIFMKRNDDYSFMSNSVVSIFSTISNPLVEVLRSLGAMSRWVEEPYNRNITGQYPNSSCLTSFVSRLVLLLPILLMGLFVSAQGTLQLQMNPSNFECGTTTVTATSACNFNGSVTVQVQGMPTGITIGNVSAVAGGVFTFEVSVTAQAPANGSLLFTVVTSDDPSGCSLPGFTAVLSFTVNCSCAINVNLDLTHESCLQCNDGRAQANVTGGNGVVTIQWSNGQVGAVAGSLAPGAYSVVVTDAIGCSASVSFTINPYICSGMLNATVSTTHETCLGCNNGSATAVVSGGSGAYAYLWSTGATTQDIGSLAPGAYTLTVTDVDGCSATVSFAIEMYVCPGFLIQSQVSHVLCYNECNGSIVISLSNGSTGFQALWSNGFTGSVLDQLCAASYTVTVTDTDHCQLIEGVEVNQPEEAMVSLVNATPAMNGQGGVIIVAYDGQTPLAAGYLKLGDIKGEINPTNNQVVFDSLVPGCYDVVLEDINGCQSELEDICVDNVSSSSDQIIEKLILLPNPATHFIRISGDELAGEFKTKIFNGSGMLIFEVFNQHIIDVQQLSDGLYFAHIEAGNDVFIGKFVKI